MFKLACWLFLSFALLIVVTAQGDEDLQQSYEMEKRGNAVRRRPVPPSPVWSVAGLGRKRSHIPPNYSLGARYGGQGKARYRGRQPTKAKIGWGLGALGK